MRLSPRRSAGAVAIVFLVLAGCEVLVGIKDRSVATDEPGADAGSDADAGGDGDAASDGDADAAPPDPACFAHIERVDELSTSTTTDQAVRFTSDGLGAYLTRAPPPPNDVVGADIFYGRRPAVDAGFLPFVKTSFSRPDVGDLDATETDDGTVYFDTYDHADPCLNCRHIWRAVRSEPGATWGMATKVIASPSNEDFEPYALGDGSVVYFVSARNMLTLDLFRAAKADFSKIDYIDESGVNLPETPERAPVVTPDDLTLYFARGPTYQVMVATRDEPGAPFANPRSVPLGETSKVRNDVPVWVSADGCELYFRSDRLDDVDIFRARRCDCGP
jgi:hypothetical protein